MATVPDEFTVTLSREHINTVLAFLWNAEENFVPQDAIKAYSASEALLAELRKTGFAPEKPHPDQLAQARKLSKRRWFVKDRK